MATKVVYQTLEDRGTEPSKLESDGPYLCKWQNSWLGKGYYFWDTFIENAHWWGKEGRAYKNGYIICKAVCDFNNTECFDLVGNTEHIKEFGDIYETYMTKGLADKKTTVKRIIEHMMNVLKKFPYTAMRAYGIRSRNQNSKYNFELLFETTKTPYLDLRPAYQICFYTKKSLNLKNYKIVYPAESAEDYLA